MTFHSEQLTFLELVGVLIGVLKGLLLSICALIQIPIYRSDGSSQLSRHIIFAVYRAFLPRFSPRALLALVPSTEDVYKGFVKASGQEPNTIVLADGTRGYWVGNCEATKTLLFFHGGGYCVPAVRQHFELLQNIIRVVNEQEETVAAVVLGHDLAAKAPYPRQLEQATGLLRYLLSDLRKDPENIIIAGDSAGGNLVLALLSHMLHPHPTTTPLNVQAQFAGAVLISPWVTFDTTTADSMRRNSCRDLLPIESVNQWAAAYRGSSPGDNYLEPLYAPVEWWKGVPARQVLFLAGADEIFVDDVVVFAKQLGKTHSHTRVEIVPHEVHDHMLLSLIFKEPPSKQQDVFVKWLRDVCSKVEE